ncbi:MAG: HPr family phosphocarrier protein [Geminicoccaceae bacterium]
MADESDPSRRTCRIVNQRGLHARAAARFVKLAETFDAEVQVSRDDLSAHGTSILGLMMLAAGTGSEVVLEAHGPEAGPALDELCELIARGFDEQD